MIRRVAIAAAVLATMPAGSGTLAIAAAAPPPGGADQPSCTYTLSTPQLVQVSGTTMVTATLTPFPCTGSIQPNSLTVCLKTAEDSETGQCGFSAVPTMARVFVPYRPGSAYVATGTGCGSVYTTQGSICSTVGPRTTTL